MIRASLRITLFVLTLGLMTSLFAAAQDEPEGIVFDFRDEAVVEYGERSDWDSRHTSAGAVIYHDGQFHMFRNGYRGWPLPSQVGYLVSDDGVNWTEVQEDPVFLHEDVPFDVKLTLLNSAHVEDDGTWVFYFSLWPEDQTMRPSGMVRATADSPTGTWTMHDEILIEPGPEGAWDGNFIGISSVLKTEDGYMMFYGGNDGDEWAVGLATSEDGLTWEKQPEPVLTKAFDWEQAIQDPRVVQTEDGFVMLYNGGNEVYNFATSEDGLIWERVQETPIIPRSTFRRHPWLPTLAYHEGIYFAYIEVDSRVGTDVFVGTYAGVMQPE